MDSAETENDAGSVAGSLEAVAGKLEPVAGPSTPPAGPFTSAVKLQLTPPTPWRGVSPSGTMEACPWRGCVTGGLTLNF